MTSRDSSNENNAVGQYQYDRPKSAFEHAMDFWLGGRGPVCAAVDPSTLQVAVERQPRDTSTADYIRWFHTGTRRERADRDYYAALKLGPCRDDVTGLLAIQFDSRGSYVPKLPAGRYGPEHTYLGNSLLMTKRVVIDSANFTPRSFAVLFGYRLTEFPTGLHSSELVQQTLDGMGNIRLLAEGAYLPMEPAGGRRFYTPLSHTRGDSAYTDMLYSLGIITLDRESLTEMLRAFNHEWTPEKGAR